jgi:hypothetical protein
MSQVHGDSIAVFVGPTAYGVGPELRSLNKQRFTWFPPIQRRDIVGLAAGYGTIVIVDGCFQATPAVGHVELRKALAHRKVYGCSSMGAIRAYEMRGMGMIGFGEVYRMFFQFEDFTDDELAQLHSPAPDYAPISEPLVNIRYFLKGLVSANKLTVTQAERIVEDLRALYFGYRTIGLLQELLCQHIGPTKAFDLVSKLPECRVKTKDFIRLMRILNNG